MSDAATSRKRRTEVFKCMEDCKYFLSTYGWIMGKDEGGIATGKIQFDLFDYQDETIDLIHKSQDTIILKARQLGISWVVAGYALWLAMFHKYQRILIISINDTEAQVFLEKVKFIFDNLPDWMKVSVYKRNESVLWFGTRLGYDTDEVGGINSKIESIPTSKTAGSSRSLNLLIIDESAKVEFIQTIWKSVQPSLSSTVGKSVLVSTMTTEPTGEFFEEMWHGARGKKNSFVPFFIPFFRRPGHDEAWLKSELLRMPASQRALAKQEHPRTEEEAFQVAGGKYFDVKVLENFHKPKLSKPKRTGYLIENAGAVEFRDDPDGVISVWQEPEALEDYTTGGDPAEGIGQDNTVTAVVRKRDFAVVARFMTNQVDPEEAAKQSAKLARWYNTSLLAVENNNTHGGMMNIVLKGIYSNLYYHEIVDRDSGSPTTRWGWHTDGQNRTWILDYLAKLIETGTIQVNDPEFYDELRDFIIDPRTGRGDHKKGKHDDYIFAVAIACWIIRENPWFDRKAYAEKKRNRVQSKPKGGY